jgi:hypothetical protein
MGTAGHIETGIAGSMPVAPVSRPLQERQATMTERARSEREAKKRVLGRRGRGVSLRHTPAYKNHHPAECGGRK